MGRHLHRGELVHGLLVLVQLAVQPLQLLVLLLQLGQQLLHVGVGPPLQLLPQQVKLRLEARQLLHGTLAWRQGVVRNPPFDARQYQVLLVEGMLGAGWPAPDAHSHCMAWRS